MLSTIRRVHSRAEVVQLAYLLDALGRLDELREVLGRGDTTHLSDGAFTLVDRPHDVADGIAGSSVSWALGALQGVFAGCMASVSRLSERVGHSAPWFDELEGCSRVCSGIFNAPKRG